jgi:hypothetical protein
LDIEGNIKIATHENDERLEGKVHREILSIREMNSCVKILLAVGGKN